MAIPTSTAPSAAPATATAGTRPKFKLGSVVMTRGVHQLFVEDKINPFALLGRHVVGDWGDLSDDDKMLNEQALNQGDGRLMSSYEIASNLKIWIITEWDRSVTTLLLPSEY